MSVRVCCNCRTPNLGLMIWEFPKIRGTMLGSPYNKDYSILGSIMGSPYFGKLPCRAKAVKDSGFKSLPLWLVGSKSVLHGVGQR